MPAGLFGFEPFTISSLRLCRRSLTGAWISFYAISLPATGGDEVVSQFFANAEDVHVHQIGQGVVAFVEQVFVQRRAGDDLAAMKRQVFENRILARGERYWPAGAGDTAGAGVDEH